MNDDPRVFADGVLTAAVGMQGVRLYVGPHQLKHVRSAKIEWDGDGVARLELTFTGSSEPGDAEAEARLAGSLRWAVVKQAPDRDPSCA